MLLNQMSIKGHLHKKILSNHMTHIFVRKISSIKILSVNAAVFEIQKSLITNERDKGIINKDNGFWHLNQIRRM